MYVRHAMAFTDRERGAIEGCQRGLCEVPFFSWEGALSSWRGLRPQIGPLRGPLGQAPSAPLPRTPPAGPRGPAEGQGQPPSKADVEMR